MAEYRGSEGLSASLSNDVAYRRFLRSPAPDLHVGARIAVACRRLRGIDRPSGAIHHRDTARLRIWVDRRRGRTPVRAVHRPGPVLAVDRRLDRRRVHRQASGSDPGVVATNRTHLRACRRRHDPGARRLLLRRAGPASAAERRGANRTTDSRRGTVRAHRRGSRQPGHGRRRRCRAAIGGRGCVRSNDAGILRLPVGVHHRVRPPGPDAGCDGRTSVRGIERQARGWIHAVVSWPPCSASSSVR